MPIAILELSFRPDDLDSSMEELYKILADTRAFTGCEGIEVLVDAKDPTRVSVLERWESEEQDAAYRAWRAGEGKTRLSTLLSEPPNLVKFRSALNL